MKAIQKNFLFFLLLLPMMSRTETKDIPFTMDDRDRIIRTEQKVESIQTGMNVRFEATGKQPNISQN